MPTRFKYTKVAPQSFALTPAEILLATDAELNQYMGLKKYAPYRKDGRNWDQKRVDRLKELKQKIRERSSALGAGEDLTKVLPEKPAKKRKGKKERMKEKAAAQDVDMAEEGEDEEKLAKATGSNGTKRKAAEEEPAEAEVPAAGESSSKKKRRRHKKVAQEVS